MQALCLPASSELVDVHEVRLARVDYCPNDCKSGPLRHPCVCAGEGDECREGTAVTLCHWLDNMMLCMWGLARKGGGSVAQLGQLTRA